MTLLKRRNDKSALSADDAGSTSKLSAAADDFKKKMLDHQGKLTRIGVVLTFLASFCLYVSSNNSQYFEMAPGISADPKFAEAVSRYDKCALSFQSPPPKKQWNTKPLWLPAFPGSGATGPAKNGDILKPLINGLTGLKAGAKFYHASSKILKRCKGRDETAVCTQAHPAVPIGPEKQTENFHHSILLGIRNFRTVYPTFHNDKAEAYHGVKGQVDESEWRKNRDEYYKSVIEGWKGLIMTWKDMKEYDIAMYIQYEALMDPDRGPTTLEKISNHLEKAGFSVAPKRDIPCIWYQVYKAETMRLNEVMQYIPGYTTEQRDFLLEELKKFQKEVADDKELVTILQEYYDDIRDNTRIDKPWENKVAIAIA